MLTKNLDKYKVETTKESLTSFAGLPLLWGMGRSLGLEEKLSGLKIKEREAVLTSYDDWAAGLVMQFHRARQDGSENINKELSGGFGLSKLPCQGMTANAAYFQIALLANIVFAALKHLALPEGWRNWTIKTVRFRLIRLAGLVMRRSRHLCLKIPIHYPFRGIFDQARCRLLGLWVEFGVV